MFRIRNSIKISVVFGALLVTAYFGLLPSSLAGNVTGPQPIVVRAEAIPLNDIAPDVRTVGGLRYLVGWSLRSANKNFGGWSGLVLAPDGKSLTAINDAGVWLTATLDLSSPEPIKDAVLLPFDEAQAGARKADYDSESIIQVPDGRFLVSFEQEHRLIYAVPGGTTSRAAYTDTIDFTDIEPNKGMEATTWTADGRLLAFIEQGGDREGWSPAWLSDGQTGEMLWFQPPRGFLPTDAATLKNGDVLVLTRHYTLVDGVAAKLVRLKAADIKAGADLVGEVIATLAPPLAVDNMEGLDVLEREGAKPLVFIISDDNFMVTQRTLFMVFELQTP